MGSRNEVGEAVLCDIEFYVPLSRLVRFCSQEYIICRSRRSVDGG